MPGLKHLIECHCTLKIYSAERKTIYHKFPVYSKLDKEGSLIKKIVKCNNCEAAHIVTDVCKSELMAGKDQTGVTTTIDDISISLPQRLVDLLNKLECDITAYEHCLDIIEEDRWGEMVVLRRDIINENESLKILVIDGENKFKIRTETIINTLRID